MAPVRLPPVTTANVSFPAPPVSVPKLVNVRLWPVSSTVPLSAPLMVQVVGPARLLVSVPLAALVMLSMAVKLLTPTLEVPLNPLALSALRLTVATPRAESTRLSDPVPPLMVVTEPAAPNVNVSPLLSAFRVLNPAYVSACALFVTVPLLAPLIAQAVALPRPLVRVPPAALVMLSMAVNVPVMPTEEVPLYPLPVPDEVRATVAAAKADRSRLSDPVPPLMVVTEPAAPNVNVSPLLSAFRVLNPAYVSACALFVTVPLLAPLIAQAVAVPRPLVRVPPAALVMLSMAVNVPVMPTEEVPLYPLPVPDEVRATVAAAKADRSRLSDPVPPLRVPMLPAAPNTKLSPLLSASSVPKLVYVNV